MKRTNAELVETMQKLKESHSQTIKTLSDESSLLANQLEECHVSRDNLQKEINTSADYIGCIEERILETNKKSLELLKKVRDLESETATLKNYIIDLKARVAVYVPIKNDPVDCKVADFINNYPDRNKLKIMFMRDSAGVYQFGQRKVKLEVTKGKIQIRVGGGFLSIDEFIDQHTPIELERLERRDPLKKFSEKVTLMKTVQGHDVVPQLDSQSGKKI